MEKEVKKTRKKKTEPKKTDTNKVETKKATKKNNQRLIDVDLIPAPKSRTEAYLHHLAQTGRVIDLDQIPKPKSRIEALLRYLCENTTQTTNDNNGIYIVGNTQEMNDLVAGGLKDGDLIHVIDPTTPTVVTDYNGEKVTIKNHPITMIFDEDVNGLRLQSRSKEVEDWEHLSCVNKYKYANLLDLTKVDENKRFELNTENIVEDPQKYYNLIKVKVSGGSPYTLFKKTVRIPFRYKELDINGALLNGPNYTETSGTEANGWIRHNFTTNQDTVEILLEVYNEGVNLGYDALVEGTETENPDGIIPYADGELIQVCTDISFQFDNSNCTLVSETYESAIKELDSKMVNPNNFVTDVAFDTSVGTNGKPNNTLKKTKNGQETNVIDHVVTEWIDLEHTQKYTHANIMDYNKKVTGFAFGTGSDFVANQDMSTYFVNGTVGSGFTVYKKSSGQIRVTFVDENNIKVDAKSIGTGRVGNYYVGWFDVESTQPNANDISKVAIEFNHNDNPQVEDVMIFVGTSVNTVNGFIPFADGELLQVGTEVSFKFDSSGSSLVSTTYESAIKELDTKLSSAGKVESINGIQPQQGSKDVLLQATPTFPSDKMTLTTNGGNDVKFAEIDCYNDAEANLLISSFV